VARTIRLSDNDILIAQKAAEINNRSIAGQIAHWMHIGRIVEQSPSYDHSRVSAALSAEISYDEMSATEQDVFLDEFFQSMRTLSDDDEAAFLAEIARKEEPFTYGGFSSGDANFLAEHMRQADCKLDAEFKDKLASVAAAGNLDALGEPGFTLLFFAVFTGKEDFVRALMKAGADPAVSDAQGNTAVHMAARLDNSLILKEILSSRPEAATLVNENTGISALMEADCRLENLELLLRSGANLDYQDKAGNTALYLANTPRHFEVVKMLLKGGADPNIKNRGGTSFVDLFIKLNPDILTDSAQQEHQNIGKILADINKRGGR